MPSSPGVRVKFPAADRDPDNVQTPDQNENLRSFPITPSYSVLLESRGQRKLLAARTTWRPRGHGCSGPRVRVLLDFCKLCQKARFRHRQLSANRHRLEFIDGSRASTCGIIKDLDWQFHDGFQASCDFLVLKGLPVDILLGNGFVEDFKVFSEQNESLAFGEDLCGLAASGAFGAFGVGLVGEFDGKLSNLDEEEYLRDLESVNPFSQPMIDKEGAQRNAIKRRIENLPPSRQEEVRDLENQRQLNWTGRKEAWEAAQRSIHQPAITDPPMPTAAAPGRASASHSTITQPIARIKPNRLWSPFQILREKLRRQTTPHDVLRTAKLLPCL